MQDSSVVSTRVSSPPELAGATPHPTSTQRLGDPVVGLTSRHANERSDLLDAVDVLEPFHSTIDCKAGHRAMTDLLTPHELDVDTIAVRKDPRETRVLLALSAHGHGDVTRISRTATLSPQRFFLFPRRILFALRWMRLHSSLVRLPRMRSRSDRRSALIAWPRSGIG